MRAGSPGWGDDKSVGHAAALSAAGTIAVLCIAVVAATVLVAGAVLLGGRTRKEPARAAADRSAPKSVEVAPTARRAAA